MKALAEAAGRAFEEVRRGASGEAPFAVAPHLLRRQLRGLGGGLDYRGVVEKQPCTVAAIVARLLPRSGPVSNISRLCERRVPA